MKKSILAMGLLGSLAMAGTAAPAFADGEDEAASSGFSGYVTLTSDYRFRGISQSDNSAALQAAVNYTHESGIFLEAWGSNVDFSPFGDPDTSIEIDGTIGYQVALSDVTDLSVKAVYYWYNDDFDYDYWEFMATLGRKIGNASASLEVAYSPETFGEAGGAWAVTGGLDFPLMDTLWFFDGGLEASAHLGYQSFDDAGLEDYTYWDLGVTATAGIFAVDVRYVDTGIDDAVCAGLCDPFDSTVVVSGTLSFGG